MRGYLDWITQAEDIEPEGEDRHHDEPKHGITVVVAVIKMSSYASLLHLVFKLKTNESRTIVSTRRRRAATLIRHRIRGGRRRSATGIGILRLFCSLELKDVLHHFFIHGCPPFFFSRIQEQSSYAPGLSQSCQISGFLLADHHFGVSEHGRPSNRALSTTRMAGFLPR